MRATHSGTCQACGRLQKLPKGHLSLHGYNVAHGFFSGICRGARELPFEQSCDLVKTFIAWAEGDLARVEGQQRHLRRPATEPKAMVRNYENLDARGRRGYVWREVEIDGRRVSGQGYQGETAEWIEYFYRAPGYLQPGTAPVEHKIDRFRNETGCVEDQSLRVATEFNKIYADWLEHEADSLRRYIRWQQERVRTWQPADLQPVDAKGAEGFTPTPPKY